jgi:hypothetical protein
MTTDMINYIKQKDNKFKIKAEEFYLYTSGSSTDTKSIDNITWEEIEIIKKKSPILSLFGAGLSSISGKCAISDLIPAQSMKKLINLKDSDDEAYQTIMPLTQTHTFFRNDDYQRNDFSKELIDIADIRRWENDHIKSVNISKEQKRSGDIKKEENSHIAQVIECESIMPNITMVSSINPLYGQTFTDIEIGLILKSLIEISKQQIGSNKRLGYGVLDWNVELNSQLMFKTISNKDYIFNKDIIRSQRCNEYIKQYNTWATKNYNAKISICDLI